jgi:polysaccharide deacetylase family protein (PEP-CTERM system associated)
VNLAAQPLHPLNGLTVDVEDWFHILEIGGADRSTWDGLPSRVTESTARVLDLLGQRGARATFFVLGWIADRHPSLAPRIAAEGHEVATHGYGHHLVYRLGRDGFRQDLRRSVRVLEDQTGRAIRGHRAPGFSITADCPWAFDVLAEEGIEYDASVCPAPHGHGGMPGAPLHPYVQRCSGGASLHEFPVSCMRLGPWRFPFSGGGYLRLLPYRVVAGQLRRLNRAGHPGIVYIHPRELDPGHPRLPMPWVRRFKSYVNLKSTPAKFGRLLEEFRFAPLAELLPVGNAP